MAAPVLSTGQPAGTVRFVYQPPVSSSCPGTSALPALERELDERLPELNALWLESGPTMTGAVHALTGREFIPPPTVALTLCDAPSNAFLGVTVNMRFAMRNFTASPVPLRYKLDTAFHEMLHNFVARHTPRPSPLLSSHSSEAFCVRNHLHLLALQKAVLVVTENPATLESVISNDSSLPSGCYRRAWSIINGTPTYYKEFVAELAQ